MTYPEFWRRYLAAHSDPRTRGVHYVGTSLAIAAIATAGVKRDWRWLLPRLLRDMLWRGSATSNSSTIGRKPLGTRSGR